MAATFSTFSTFFVASLLAGSVFAAPLPSHGRVRRSQPEVYPPNYVPEQSYPYPYDGQEYSNVYQPPTHENYYPPQYYPPSYETYPPAHPVKPYPSYQPEHPIYDPPYVPKPKPTKTVHPDPYYPVPTYHEQWEKPQPYCEEPPKHVPWYNDWYQWAYNKPYPPVHKPVPVHPKPVYPPGHVIEYPTATHDVEPELPTQIYNGGRVWYMPMPPQQSSVAEDPATSTIEEVASTTEDIASTSTESAADNTAEVIGTETTTAGGVAPTDQVADPVEGPVQV